MDSEVILYTKADCPYCDRAKQWLGSKQVAFQELRIDLDPSLKEEMLARSQGRRTVPQIFINGEGIGGFDDLIALDRQGKLKL